MSAALQRRWYEPRPAPLVLRPLARLYGYVADRRAARQRAAAERLPVPVVVVGNVAVGGTGKTPCTLWLVHRLRELGRHPGILSHGYGGTGPFPCRVEEDTSPAQSGDEPLLLARRSGVPLACAPDRVAAGRSLLAAHPDIDVLVCDDGLQHYRLARDLEFCVIDGARGFGNGWRLPAGPLREAPERAGDCALLFVNGAEAEPYGAQAVRFDLHASSAQRVGGTERRALADFAGIPLAAVAGIGHPQRFFDTLEAHGLDVEARAFADHHVYQAADLSFAHDRPLLMTEKDAVKCAALGLPELWFVPVTARFNPVDAARVTECLARLLPGHEMLS